MGLRDMYSAGDIIEYEGGGRDYLVSIEGEEGLWVNACNPSWIERGLRSFCDECRPFFSDRLYEGAEVVGHLGGGTVEDASRWYEENQGVISGLSVLRWTAVSFLDGGLHMGTGGALSSSTPGSPCPIGVKSWRIRTTKCS